jgi:EamA domain-containing membrane protein RarD
MNQLQIKRSIALTSISVVVSFAAFMNITRHSNIRAVEILIILTLWMSISALIFNIAHLYKAKKSS